jgi:LacI family transcriptional regulator
LTTIKEIAKKAGVSYSTVSRSLNNKKGVRADVRELIMNIASDMAYFPHSSAQALVKNRVGILGIIITRSGEFAFQNPYIPLVLMGINEGAVEHDYKLMLSINEKKSYVALYFRRLVDGIIVVGNRLDDRLIDDLVGNKVPAVLIPGLLDNSKNDIPSVNSENSKSVCQAVEYLLSLGHRRIAFIIGQMNSKYSVERFQAYRMAFKNNGLAYDPQYIVESDFSKIGGFRMMEQLLNLPERPSAVICMNDFITPGALSKIQNRGLKIPEDISVIAIGSSDSLDLYQPALTTVKISASQIGHAASEMLISLIESGSYPERHVVIPSQLIIRESTKEWRE